MDQMTFQWHVRCAKYFVAAAGLLFTAFDSVLMDLLIKLAAKGRIRSYRSSFHFVSQEGFFFWLLLFTINSVVNDCKKVCESVRAQKAVITYIWVIL